MSDAITEYHPNDPIRQLSTTLRSHPNGHELARILHRRLHARIRCDAMIRGIKATDSKPNPMFYPMNAKQGFKEFK
ncbi:MAG TPA: hypothetical protein VMG59_13065 [Phycisphaerae bacterium]|nr:hypothetical protein [Phycisphaerae bacterium]